MTSQAAALRHGLTAHDRALLKRIIDTEIRRRHENERERIDATKRRYLAQHPCRPVSRFIPVR